MYEHIVIILYHILSREKHVQSLIVFYPVLQTSDDEVLEPVKKKGRRDAANASTTQILKDGDEENKVTSFKNKKSGERYKASYSFSRNCLWNGFKVSILVSLMTSVLFQLSRMERR